MFKRMAIVGLLCVLSAGALAGNLLPDARDDRQQQPQTKPRSTEILTDAAIIVLIIAASVAAYKAMGKPCACPSDTMRNGRTCGNNSAWARPGGVKPLCFPTDVTASMIAAYRAAKTIPGLR